MLPFPGTSEYYYLRTFQTNDYNMQQQPSLDAAFKRTTTVPCENRGLERSTFRYVSSSPFSLFFVSFFCCQLSSCIILFIVRTYFLPCQKKKGSGKLLPIGAINRYKIIRPTIKQRLEEYFSYHTYNHVRNTSEISNNK